MQVLEQVPSEDIVGEKRIKCHLPEARMVVGYRCIMISNLWTRVGSRLKPYRHWYPTIVSPFVSFHLSLRESILSYMTVEVTFLTFKWYNV